MREILFRGKRTDTKEWVEGMAFPHDNNRVTMFRQHSVDGVLTGEEVDPETVGQFTGFIDKNGTKIFEDDICHFYGGECYNGCWEANHTCIIEINHECLWYLENAENVEIIGNIYDNPELLESVNDDEAIPEWASGLYDKFIKDSKSNEEINL